MPCTLLTRVLKHPVHYEDSGIATSHEFRGVALGDVVCQTGDPTEGKSDGLALKHPGKVDKESRGRQERLSQTDNAQ